MDRRDRNNIAARSAGALLVLALLLVATLPAAAVEVAGLYEAEVPVAGQGGEERTEAIRTAMGQVLVKVSGKGDVRLVPEVSAALEQAARYVQQYRYRDTTATPSGQGPALWVRFDKGAIDRILEDNGLPIWGRARPSVLLWLAVEEDGERHLVGSTTDSEARELVESRARRRGLPVQWPLMDLEDQGSVQVSDVWGNFGDTLLGASERYGAEAVLVGRVYYRVDTGLWGARWSLYQGGEAVTWSAEGAVLAEVIDPGVDGAVGVLSASFTRSYNALAEDRVAIEVTDVAALGDYAAVRRYLESLATVTDVQPVAVEPGRVTFAVKAHSGPAGLGRAIELGNTLVPVADLPHVRTGGSDGKAGVLRYRFLP